MLKVRMNKRGRIKMRGRGMERGIGEKKRDLGSITEFKTGHGFSFSQATNWIKGETEVVWTGAEKW